MKKEVYPIYKEITENSNDYAEELLNYNSSENEKNIQVYFHENYTGVFEP